MSNSRNQKHYKAMYIPTKAKGQRNVFLGAAFEIEKPVSTLFKSFWNVLTSPVEGRKSLTVS